MLNVESINYGDMILSSWFENFFDLNLLNQSNEINIDDLNYQINQNTYVIDINDILKSDKSIYNIIISNISTSENILGKALSRIKSTQCIVKINITQQSLDSKLTTLNNTKKSISILKANFKKFIPVDSLITLSSTGIDLILNKHKDLIPFKNNFFSTSRYITVRYSDWQQHLNNNILISEVSLPGTHDTCALRFDLYNLQCQSLSLWDQLQIGVRYIDIRLGVVDNGILIFHGKGYMGVSFYDVLITLKEFLRLHPTEFVLMRNKVENKEYQQMDFFEVYKYYMKEFKELFYMEGDVPIIEKCRGKVFVFNEGFDEYYDIMKSGIDNEDNTKNKLIFYHWSNIILQDDFYLNTSDLTNKKLAVLKHFTLSNENKNFHVNHLSAFGHLDKSYPFQIAFQMNKFFYEFTEDENNNDKIAFMGIPVFDFITAELCSKVIKFNKFNLIHN